MSHFSFLINFMPSQHTVIFSSCFEYDQEAWFGHTHHQTPPTSHWAQYLLRKTLHQDGRQRRSKRAACRSILFNQHRDSRQLNHPGQYRTWLSGQCRFLKASVPAGCQAGHRTGPQATGALVSLVEDHTGSFFFFNLKKVTIYNFYIYKLLTNYHKIKAKCFKHTFNKCLMSYE